MALKEYDIAGAFQAVEYELINSFLRNMKRHRVEEVKEQKQWEMWQVKQLQELDLYKKRNAKKYGARFVDINKTVAEMIRLANEEGQMDQETEILEAMKEGLKPKRASKALTAQFFRTNERKLNALIDATTHDMEAAETAILRKANDVYRKTIFNAQVYANTGAGTYEKAVDMATKDLMAAGLTCVEYKNGARHTLPDYADMALRTANKRAYLQGEGAKRQEWGIHTVIVNKRLKACPHCMPFAGKVFIDDVWGGGTKEDGNYPLLSTAIEAGLYHPRCRDSHTAYFPGITDRPGKYTKTEVKAAERAEEKEEKESYARRQAEKYQRLADTRMDQENRLVDQHKANRWKEEAAPFNPAKTIEEAQEYAEKFCQTSFMDKTFKGKVNFKGISLEHANAINRSLTEAYNRFPDMEKLSGIKTVAPGSAQGKKAFKSGADALFSYSPVEHGIFINKDVLKSPKTLDAYMQRSQDAWDLVMNNIDKLSGKHHKLAEIYSKAGRELVAGDTVEGLFTHELGHHVQWTMLDPKTTNSLTSRMSEFAPHISGYANASNSEYLAESFVAYMKDEIDLIDPEYVGLLDRKSSNVLRKDIFERANHKDDIRNIDLRMSISMDDFSEDEMRALSEYISFRGYEINDKLRRGINKSLLSEEEHVFVRHLDTALLKNENYVGVVYRSINTDLMDEEAFNAQHIPGNLVVYESYTSTSKEIYDESMKYQFVIKSKRGKDISWYNTNEQEVLFKRGSCFVVTDRKGNTIYMEEV